MIHKHIYIEGFLNILHTKVCVQSTERDPQGTYSNSAQEHDVTFCFVSMPEPEQEPQTVRKVRTYSKPSQNSGSDSDSSSNSDSVVQLYRIPKRRNPNTHTADTPSPVTSMSTPAISHSSPSHSTDSIS